MRNLKLVLEYDGSRFAGWQIQARERTVQGEIRSVLRKLLGEEVQLHGAGRTDAGVHARAQAANFRTSSHLPASTIQRALNALLPEDIAVVGAEDVAADFHARYSARWRIYSYTLTRRRTPLGRHALWVVTCPLEVERMQRLAAKVRGEHDFRSFCTSASEVKGFRCTVADSFWTETGEHLVFEIRANRFLHGMVRALVGTMVDAGRGHLAGDSFEAILAGGDRRLAGPAAPAKGLVLERVLYGDADPAG
ncbi:MAG: tRNA pseudouridine(38-40) synthase TruA [Bacteroidota bacterium]